MSLVSLTPPPLIYTDIHVGCSTDIHVGSHTDIHVGSHTDIHVGSQVIRTFRRSSIYSVRMTGSFPRVWSRSVYLQIAVLQHSTTAQYYSTVLQHGAEENWAKVVAVNYLCMPLR